MKDFNDKVVVIPGGGTGIGFAFAKALGANGAKIVLAARREDRLQEAVAELNDMDVEARYSICDVSNPDSVEALADFAWEAFGHVDVIINNAGIILPNAPVVDTPVESVHRIFGVNFFGVWHGSTIFGKRFIEQGTPASIYNVGSENSLFLAAPMAAAYVATKHAVLAITEALREETPEYIEVGLICPGFVRSEIGPAEGMALGMDTDQYAEIAVKQMKAGEFYIVSHAFNMERIDARYKEIANAYSTYAPRYDGDDEFDVRTLAGTLATAWESADT